MEVRKEDQRDQDEKVVEIEIERLRDFKNHPSGIREKMLYSERDSDDAWHKPADRI